MRDEGDVWGPSSPSLIERSAALLHFRGKKHTCIFKVQLYCIFGEKNIPAFSSGFLMTLVAPLILSHNCNANDRYI
jgi:hypothetical protein